MIHLKWWQGKTYNWVGQESDTMWFSFDGEIINFKEKENIRVQYQTKQTKKLYNKC